MSVANATGGVASDSLSVAVLAVSALPTATTSTTVPAKTLKTVKTVKTVKPVKPKNKNAASAIGTTLPVIANVSNISTGTTGASGSVVLPVEAPGLISVCVNKSTSVLRDTADNSCSSGSEIKVEWLDTGMSPKICVNNNNREMTLAQDGKCSTKNSAVADVMVSKQILACADDKTGVLRYRASGLCGTNTDPVAWVLKDQGVARNVSDAVKTAGIQTISLVNLATTNMPTDSARTTIATTATIVTTTTATTSATTTTTAVPTATTSTTTTTIALRAVGSFAGYFGGTCPDGSGIPWYWHSDSRARAGGCSAAASIAPTTTAPATTTTAVSATTTTTVAPVVPGTPGTPTGVAGNTQVTVSVTAGTGGTPTSYTITKSTDGVNYSTGCTVTGASGSCVVTGLTNGTTYFFKTTATNSAGTSSLSSASASVTPATVPGAPTIGTATIASATSVTVSCTGPLQTTPAGSNGGAAIDSYTFTSSPAGGTVTINSLTCTTTTIPGLTTGTAYTFTVTATNSAGTSVASAASNSVTPAITCATGGTCILGNTGPGGGRVFYVSAANFTSTGSACGTACKYLEYAPTGWIVATTPAGQTNCAAIAGTSSNDPKCQYVPTGALTSTLLWPTTCPPPSCTAMNIGSGHSNTTTWLGQSASAGYAPTVARAYQGGGLTDWHLPSKHELNQMCRDVWGLVLDNTDITCSGMTGTIRVGFLSDGSFYGSSTEYQANGNHALRFSDGIWANNAKSSAGAVVVRPVRAFG